MGQPENDTLPAAQPDVGQEVQAQQGDTAGTKLNELVAKAKEAINAVETFKDVPAEKTVEALLDIADDIQQRINAIGETMIGG